MVNPTDAAHELFGVDPDEMRALLVHEARVHALPGRELRDLGDGLLLYDPDDPDPFWNRFEGVRWPSEPKAFERRLGELLVQFSTMDRRPHVWASPLHDEPDDLAERLIEAGFEDVGAGLLMLLVDPDASARRVADMDELRGEGVELVRFTTITGREAESAAAEIVDVLLDAFGVEEARSGPIRAETVASLAHPWFTHYLVRWRGSPAAVCRRATFDGLTYLSSVGTAPAARGRGFAGLASAAAAIDGHRAGSRRVTLGAFAENDRAVRLYRRLGFDVLGAPAPDLLLFR